MHKIALSLITAVLARQDLIWSSTVGIKGFTFKSSCDSSVAIAPAK